MCMKEQTLKRKHGSRRQGWGGEGTIDYIWVPIGQCEHSVLKPSRLLLSPRGKGQKYAQETIMVLQEENA